MSRFPKLTETFVLNEILAFERLGVEVELYPLLRERDRVLQPGAERLVPRAHYLPSLSRSVVASQLRFLRLRPRAYLGSLVDLVRDNFGSPRFLAAGLVLFPKIVHAARLIARTDVDHVHCHFATHPALAGLIIRRLTGTPFSFTAHGSDIHIDRHMLCRKLSEASFAIAISRFNQQVIEAECGSRARDKVHVLHCGVDTDVFRPRAGGRQPSAAPQALRILSIGTLHEVKGQRYLLEACARLKEMGVPFTCRLVGRGPDEQLLRSMIRRLGLEDRVLVLGALARDAVLRELGDADVLAAPSVPTSDGKREGIPVVLMEAMSCGVPVVASRLSGIPELVENEQTGLLVTPGNAEELATALCRIATEPDLRRRLGAQGRQRVERDFDLRANATRLLAIIAEQAAP